jgi:hypothetical protein
MAIISDGEVRSRDRLIGSRFANCIKASGHMRRVNRPDIWPRPTNSQNGLQTSCPQGAST